MARLLQHMLLPGHNSCKTMCQLMTSMPCIISARSTCCGLGVAQQVGAGLATLHTQAFPPRPANPVGLFETAPHTLTSNSLSEPNYLQVAQQPIGADLPYMEISCEDSSIHSAEYVSAPTLHPYVKYRSTYPESVWAAIDVLFPSKPPGVGALRGGQQVIDIGCAGGTAAFELVRRGYHLTGIEADVHMLARARLRAQAERVPVRLICSSQSRALLPSGMAQLVTVLHGFHLLQPRAALQEIHRLLADDGYLVVCWNNRALGHPFIDDLESLLERHNPGYKRDMRQHPPGLWTPILTRGNLLKLQDYSVHPNPFHLRHLGALVDLLAYSPTMHPTLNHDPSLRKAFRVDLRALVKRHTDSLADSSGGLILPVETRMYVLSKQ